MHAVVGLRSEESRRPGGSMGTPKLPLRLGTTGIALAVCLAVPAFAQVTGMTVRRDVHHDVSPPLREMIKNVPPPSLERHEAEPVRPIPLPPGLTLGEE